MDNSIMKLCPQVKLWKPDRYKNKVANMES